MSATGPAARLLVALAAALVLAGPGGPPAPLLAADALKHDARHEAVFSDGQPRALPTAALAGVAAARSAGMVAGEEGADEATGRATTLAAPGYPGVGTSAIHGPDQRKLVKKTTRAPYRAVVQIDVRLGGQYGRCTGWLASWDTVVTAGHCLHTGGHLGGWATVLGVYPGRQGALLPYGGCGARWTASVLGWVMQASADYDYGVIKLTCQVGRRTGHFGFRYGTTPMLNEGAALVGYPGDKPYTAWQTNDRVRHSTAQRLFYQNDTVGGMDGAPVFNGKVRRCKNCVIAIHTSGGWPHNGGTRINRQVYDNLLYWRALP